jgi:hypothetical protein
MAKPPLFSSRKNSRCKPCRSAPQAPSTPPPLPTAKSTKSNITPAKLSPPKPTPISRNRRRSLLEFFRLLRTGTKYIWDLALDKSGNLYVATGDHGEIFRVTPKGEHSVFFKSDETHIRVLAFDAQDDLIAGSDGSGLIYRISPAGDGFVLYSAPKKEITALALDRSGNIYAAAVGEKKPEALRPPQPSTQPCSPWARTSPGGARRFPA